ncbi:inner centromere protein A-like isoform X2 [Prorops nasuta]|uniref:inner centromere protein A-like isoform X2 n=1 Tax=Prorops nasuta TaxID=863751 RepID=UPI0034CD0CED
MEISETTVKINNHSSNFISLHIKEENDEIRDVDITTDAQHFCAIEIKESKSYGINTESEEFNLGDESSDNNRNDISAIDGTVQESNNCTISTALSDSIYLSTLDSESINETIESQADQSSEIFTTHNDEPTQTSSYSISSVALPNEFLENLNLNIKKETAVSTERFYTTEWFYNINNEEGQIIKTSKDKQIVQIPVDIEATITPIVKCRGQLSEDQKFGKAEAIRPERPRKKVRLKSLPVQDYKEKLRKKAEFMREKRRKLYEQETEEQRLQRLAKVAAKRREMRMYYETPEQRRKRLDAEAARKREYRMYNETPEDRRKRLDREAERRRMKRLSMYANETSEQRRERLNKESAKRREARLNQYAKETEEERKERLQRDALRAREMRFTRSAIETEEERRQRLFEILKN